MFIIGLLLLITDLMENWLSKGQTALVDGLQAGCEAFDRSELDAMSADPEALLEVATASAEEAGDKLLKLFQRPEKLSIRRKYDYAGSIVTNADIASERIILRNIKRSKIKSTVNSEEAGIVDYGYARHRLGAGSA